MTPRPGGADICGGYVLGAILVTRTEAPLAGPALSYVRCARCIAVLGLRPGTGPTLRLSIRRFAGQACMRPDNAGPDRSVGKADDKPYRAAPNSETLLCGPAIVGLRTSSP